MISTCIAVTYVDGKFARIPASERDRRVREGWIIQRKSRSFENSYDAVFPSFLKLSLRTEDGRQHDVRIDSFFKARIGRLSERRRDAIIATMPPTISIAWRYGRSGHFIAVSRRELEAWAVRAEERLGTKRRGSKA